MNREIVVVIGLAMLVAGLAGCASHTAGDLQVSNMPATAASDRVLGEELVRVLWADFKAGKIAALEEMMPPGFQSVHEDGSRDRAQQLELLVGLSLGEYQLSDYCVTCPGDVMIVTYKVTVAETIDGRRLARKPAARMSVFQLQNGEWKWIAHANLRALD
jgi:uncharacterized protein DUF4440